MYDQIREDTLFIILYSVVTAMSLMASIYLLFRRANAIAPDITPPVHLRRWAAVLPQILRHQYTFVAGLQASLRSTHWIMYGICPSFFSPQARISGYATL